MNKIICCDWGYYIHTAIFSPSDIPSAWTCCNMLLSDLNKIGVSIQDIILICVDNHYYIGWRKLLSKEYKGDRRAKREASKIDFDKEFNNMNLLRENLEDSTPFHFISCSTQFKNQTVSLEADDVMSVAVRYFSDKEVVIISRDSDLKQLYFFPNVKIFNPKLKRYIEVKNPLEILSKKIIGKEKSDNLNEVVNTEIDHALRKATVSLLELPIEIEEIVKKHLDILEDKCYNVSLFRYEKLLDKLLRIINNDYDEEKIITYEKSLVIAEKKEKLKKIKKEKKKQLTLKL